MLRIFVLDDCPTIRRVLQGTLAGLGSVVASDQWSELSRPLLSAHAGAVLVCDLDMPGIDGAEFCRIVRRFNRAVRIVIFTGSPERAPHGVADCVISKREGFSALQAWLSELDAASVG